MSATITFSLRIDQDLLDRIDQSATHNGQTRTAYVLSWLPDTYDRDTNNSETRVDGDVR